jgi:hypothetical protein
MSLLSVRYYAYHYVCACISYRHIFSLENQSVDDVTESFLVSPRFVASNVVIENFILYLEIIYNACDFNNTLNLLIRSNVLKILSVAVARCLRTQLTPRKAILYAVAVCVLLHSM